MADRSVAFLEPFEVSRAARGASQFARRAPRIPNWSGLPVRLDARVWLGGRQRQLICRANEEWCLLEADGLARLAVHPAAGQIFRLADGRGDPAGLADDLAVGPGLALVLADRGVFCLHASAASIEGRVRLFVGDSGAGKSTLVAGVPAGVVRVADDIVPCAAARDAPGPVVYPDYPQLKLPREAQMTASEPLAVASISVLDTTPPTGDALVESNPLGAAASMLILARQTVAAALFSPRLLEAHLDFCAALRRAVPIEAIRYHRDLGSLGALRRALLV